MSDLIRVTDVLKIICDKNLEDFKKSVGLKYFDKIMQNAAARGIRFHSSTEFMEKNIKDKTAIDIYLRAAKAKNPEIAPAIETYHDWFVENVIEVIATEERMQCDLHGITGQIDLLCKLKGFDNIILVDKKFTAKMQKKYDLQTAAYAYLIERKYKILPHRMILRFDKTGKMEMRDIPPGNFELDFETYKAALKIYRYFEGNNDS
jgi:predicted RecB family nuclease